MCLSCPSSSQSRDVVEVLGGCTTPAYKFGEKTPPAGEYAGELSTRTFVSQLRRVSNVSFLVYHWRCNRNFNDLKRPVEYSCSTTRTFGRHFSSTELRICSFQRQQSHVTFINRRQACSIGCSAWNAAPDWLPAATHLQSYLGHLTSHAAAILERVHAYFIQNGRVASFGRRRVLLQG